MPSDAYSGAHHFIEEHKDDEHFDVTLRFTNIPDPELLLIDISLLLESLGEEGYILDSSTEED